MFALVEGDDEKASISPLGVRGVTRAWDVAQSSTSPAKDYDVPNAFIGGLGKETFSRAVWGDGASRTRGDDGVSPSPGRLLENNGDGETFFLCVIRLSWQVVSVSRLDEDRCVLFTGT